MTDKKRIVNEAAASEAGILLLRCLAEDVGALQDLNNTAIKSNGGLDVPSLEFNEGRRSLYLDLRRYMTKETIIKVELEGVRQ